MGSLLASAGGMAGSGEADWVYSTPLAYGNLKRGTAVLLTYSGFLAVLFFLASGNILYFKLFTDLQAERAQFRTLTRLGFTTADMRRVVTVQTGILFYAPLLFALLHGTLALAILTRSWGVSPWEPVGLVGLVYAGLFTGYFLAPRRAYTAALLGG